MHDVQLGAVAFRQRSGIGDCGRRGVREIGGKENVSKLDAGQRINHGSPPTYCLRHALDARLVTFRRHHAHSPHAAVTAAFRLACDSASAAVTARSISCG